MSKVAVISFPGMNCEVETVSALRRADMDALIVRWNASHDDLHNVDAYFLPGGFSYEDRGRAGMVAAHDTMLAFLSDEVSRGKTVVGHCNGAQVLVESGLIPLGRELTMCLAHNIADNSPAGFLSQWVWMKPACDRKRCATSDWNGVMHAPIAHGEGRFTTRDPDVLRELKKQNLIAFQYCDAEGNPADNPTITPNGSLLGIAGLCNPAGTVVALMPHPERTRNGDPYFASLTRWLKEKHAFFTQKTSSWKADAMQTPNIPSDSAEIFIATTIVHNEERTIEMLLRRTHPTLRVKQMTYLRAPFADLAKILSSFSVFNPNKHAAYVRYNGTLMRWDPRTKKLAEMKNLPFSAGCTLLRLDDVPSEVVQGTCYVFSGVSEDALLQESILTVLRNPHASSLERLADLTLAG